LPGHLDEGGNPPSRHQRRLSYRHRRLRARNRELPAAESLACLPLPGNVKIHDGASRVTTAWPTGDMPHPFDCRARQVTASRSFISSYACIKNCVDEFVNLAVRVLDFRRVASINARLPSELQARSSARSRPSTRDRLESRTATHVPSTIRAPHIAPVFGRSLVCCAPESRDTSPPRITTKSAAPALRRARPPPEGGSPHFSGPSSFRSQIVGSLWPAKMAPFQAATDIPDDDHCDAAS
jgi:hypothetical protein